MNGLLVDITPSTRLPPPATDDVMIGVDDDDLPAAQSFNGNSEILVAPAWRLPRNVTRRRDAKRWVEERITADYGIHTADWYDLGGMYHPSPGLTPERVYPFAVEIDARVGEGSRAVHWLSVRDAVANASHIRDGHLRIVLFRAWHALGVTLIRSGGQVSCEV